MSTETEATTGKKKYGLSLSLAKWIASELLQSEKTSPNDKVKLLQFLERNSRWQRREKTKPEESQSVSSIDVEVLAAEEAAKVQRAEQSSSMQSLRKFREQESEGGLAKCLTTGN